MRPTTISQTGSGESNWVPLDTYKNPFNVSLAVVVTGTVNYTVQHTLDNVQDAAVTPTAFDHEYLTGLAASQDGNYAFPVRAVRIKVNSGSGTAALTIQQAG
jgi:hypothetical protein